MRGRFAVWIRLALASALLLPSGCAVVAKRNRRLLNRLDRSIRFERTLTRVAAAPVFMPVGTAALVADAAIVQPWACAPRAADDTMDLLWRRRRESEFRETLLVPLRAAATPVVFSVDWAARCAAPFPEKERR